MSDQIDDKEQLVGSNGLTHSAGGVMGWAAQNHVFANLLMVFLIVGGLFQLTQIKQEVFPEFELDIIIVDLIYPGASPSEVEQGVVLAVEEAVRSVDDVKRITSTAAEGLGRVVVELQTNSDVAQARSDIETAVNRIQSFPADAERPTFTLASNVSEVISLMVYGDIDERELRSVAERVRDDLLDTDEISEVELAAVRPYEISVEIPRENLRRYNLTLDQVAAQIRQASVDLPGGVVRTDSGEILIRTTERRNDAEGFGDVVVLADPRGSTVRVRDLGVVIDGFEDSDQSAFFNGMRAARVDVFRVGDETPIDVATAVKDYAAEMGPAMPPGVQLAIWNDGAEYLEQRIDLLLRNATIGLILVLLLLGLFLEPRLAFWVTMGIPVSFCGALWLMPQFDVSINMISLFAFIVTLGLVVDDAIVVGEAIFYEREKGASRMAAAIIGVKSVAKPVTFSIATTIIAFMPMLFVPGGSGKFFRNIPLIVIAVLLISLVEGLLILPAHLSGLKNPERGSITDLVLRVQGRVSALLAWFIDRIYAPVLGFALRYRYFTLGLAIATLIISVGFVAGGRIQRSFMPDIESDIIDVSIRMPFGTPVERTDAVVQHVVESIQTAYDGVQDPERAGQRGLFAQVGNFAPTFGAAMGDFGSTGSHYGQVSLLLVPVDSRSYTASEFTQVWREAVGELPGVEKMQFVYSTGPGGGAAITLRLSHQDIDTLEQAAEDLAAELSGYDGVVSVDTGFSLGKEQLDIELSDHARQLGVTELSLAQQLRSAFFGAEAVRQQRGRDEVRTYVRLPRDQRASLYDFDNLMVRTPAGGEIPMSEAAIVTRGRSYTSIRREDGRRITEITADVSSPAIDVGMIVEDLSAGFIPRLIDRTPGLRFSLGGDQQDQAETNASLSRGLILAVAAMFALMAMAFRSYVQPLIILVAIPFGFVGALWGHVILGYGLSLMSFMGIVALAGVVVNDSIVLVTAINEFRAAGESLMDSVKMGGTRRFRPIILTSLTTFFGLFPMILETSVQARFLIPMAISLGCGVLFATYIILLLVPALYLIVEDIRSEIRRVFDFVTGGRGSGPDAPPAPRQRTEPMGAIPTTRPLSELARE